MGATCLNKAEAASAAFCCLIISSGEGDLEAVEIALASAAALLRFLSSDETEIALVGTIVAAAAKAKTLFPFANS